MKGSVGQFSSRDLWKSRVSLTFNNVPTCPFTSIGPQNQEIGYFNCEKVGRGAIVVHKNPIEMDVDVSGGFNVSFGHF